VEKLAMNIIVQQKLKDVVLIKKENINAIA